MAGRLLVLVVALACFASASALADEDFSHRSVALALDPTSTLDGHGSPLHGRPLMREEVGADFSRKQSTWPYSTAQFLPNGKMWLLAEGKDLDLAEAQTTEAPSASDTASDTIGSVVNASKNITNKTAAEVIGVKRNTASDTPAFIGALTCNFTTFVFFCLIFSCLRERVPQVYMNNARTEEEGGLGSAPFRPGHGMFDWIRASLRCTVEEAETASGLDIAQLIESLNFSLKTLLVLAVPLACILCPLHCYLGGAGYADFLAMTSMANVVDGSWLYWVHAVTVWYVIVVVQRTAFKAQEEFLPRRFKWLKTLPHPTSNTVMVEGIPPRYCSDSAVMKYFSEMFPGNTIESAHVAMHTEELKRLMKGLHEEQLALERAEHASHVEDEEGEGPGTDHDEALHPFVQAVQEKKAQVEQKRAELLEKSEAVDRLLLRQLQSIEKGVDEPLTANEEQMLRNSVYSQSGFVTFKDEREAMLMLHMQCSEDALEFVMSAPPDPADVIYKDLLRGPKQQATMTLIGTTILFAIGLISVPMVTAMAYFTQMDVLKEKLPFIKDATKNNPGLEHILKGLLGSMAITIWNSFMPTIIMLVLYSFFPLKAHAWAQVKLQGYYFWVQAVFTILVTAVGSSPAGRLEQLVESPLSVFELLAESLPYSTNFYFNWITLQWSLVGTDLLRYMVLIKYKILSRVFDEPVAIELSEPEDTDFYGLGGRSARFNIMLAVALVFSTLSPLILVLSVIDFCLRRVVYGYLLIFAETRKPDLGGVSWVLSLQQVQQSLIIYWILMIGVLNHHAEGSGPMLLAAPSLLFGIYTYWRFQTGLRWESLPFHWVCSDRYLEKSETTKVREASRDSFMQDELRPPNELPTRRNTTVRGIALAVHRLSAVQFRRSSLALRRSTLGLAGLSEGGLSAARLPGISEEGPSSSSSFAAAATPSGDPFLVE